MKTAGGQPGREDNAQNSFAGSSSLVAASLSSARLRRLLCALLQGPKSREILDVRVGTTNAPHYVMELRKRGFSIPCERIPARDRDGKACRYGRYRLTPEDAEKAAAILTEAGA